MENSKEIAHVALKMLERVDLKGSEVGVFLEVNKMLGKIYDGSLEVVTPQPPMLEAVDDG